MVGLGGDLIDLADITREQSDSSSLTGLAGRGDVVGYNGGFLRLVRA